MTMTFNAKEAAKITNAAREAQQERARKAAETHLINMVEPQIRAAAERGEHQADINFHNSVITMYEIISVFLSENGFKASFNCERTCLHIKW